MNDSKFMCKNIETYTYANLQIILENILYPRLSPEKYDFSNFLSWQKKCD